MASDQTPGLPRRVFLKQAGSLLLAGSISSYLLACDSGSTEGDVPAGQGIDLNGDTLTIDLTASVASDLSAAGGFLLLNVVGGTNTSVMLANIDGTVIRAFTSVCPHEQCRDNWRYQSSQRRFQCTCHDSFFDENGARVSGPARSGLTQYPVTRTGDVLSVVL